MKIIVVGAVAGGATTASQIRRLSQEAEITIYEKDRDMSFANCGLPYYIGEEIETRDKLLSATPQQFKEDKNINVFTYHEVININPEQNIAIIKDIKNDTVFEAQYDYLVLSPGATEVILPVFNQKNVFSLRNLEDTDRIENFISANHVKDILVVGAGYISLELVENFANRGLNVTMVHRSDHLLKSVDKNMTDHIKNILEENNIRVLLNDEVKSIDNNTVTFKSGRKFKYDMVISAIGIQPNTSFLKQSNIALNERGHIKVNAYFETNYKNIYALGDAVETHYRHVNEPAQIALAWGAHRAANIIAKNIIDNRSEAFKGLLGTNIIRIFDYTFASVGIPPVLLDKFDNVCITQRQKYRAGYMPEPEDITLSVYYDKKNRKILRASAWGKHGVDKRIDIIATAMIGALTIDDLRDIEVAYSPVYSSPKDIINMIGYKAQNQ